MSLVSSCVSLSFRLRSSDISVLFAAKLLPFISFFLVSSPFCLFRMIFSCSKVYNLSYSSLIWVMVSVLRLSSQMLSSWRSSFRDVNARDGLGFRLTVCIDSFDKFLSNSGVWLPSFFWCCWRHTLGETCCFRGEWSVFNA